MTAVHEILKFLSFVQQQEQFIDAFDIDQPNSVFLCGTALGSAIVVEFVVVFFLGVLLLFFTCRCAIVLINERRSCDVKNIRLSKVSSLHKPTVSVPQTSSLPK